MEYRKLPRALRTARRLLGTGSVDLFVFSIDPACDYRKGEYAKGEITERVRLYRDCEKEAWVSRS